MDATMKNTASEFEKQAKDAIQACLSDVPFCQVKSWADPDNAADDGIDFIAKVATLTGEQTLVIQAKSNGQPRWARSAVGELALYRSKNPEAYCIFVAPYITEEAGRIAAENNVGYIDLAGNCRIAFNQIYIRREGRENNLTTRRDLRSLYSPKAERVIRVLLLEPKRGWKVEELAKAADVSLGQVSNVKKLLEGREWLKREKAGLELVAPKKLLAEWAENYEPKRSKAKSFYSLETPGTVEAKVAESCHGLGVRYAITSFSGAARLAPAVRYQRASIYVEEKLDEVALKAGLKPVTTGANVTLIEPYDAGVFFGAVTIGGAEVATPVQIYLDLVGLPGRGSEAAEALLREVIERSW
jgi:hypothetical protein